ncbi:lasso peptide biosynthesis PqqD family chaperone [Streptomyces flavalbus]|uniref:Lasso peptide biosynthesis PqqD family chaperone n=1 Tax=Streptomyces flavalbus TaxID=2665155 RepID=A0ABW2W236_9ACTN
MPLQFAAHVSSAKTDYGTVLLDERGGEYWELNPSASLVIGVLMAGGDESAASGALMAEFDVDAESAERDVAALVRQLRASGLAE